MFIYYLEYHQRTFILPPNLTRYYRGWANPGDKLINGIRVMYHDSNDSRSLLQESCLQMLASIYIYISVSKRKGSVRPPEASGEWPYLHQSIVSSDYNFHQICPALSTTFDEFETIPDLKCLGKPPSTSTIFFHTPPPCCKIFHTPPYGPQFFLYTPHFRPAPPVINVKSLTCHYLSIWKFSINVAFVSNVTKLLLCFSA